MRSPPATTDRSVDQPPFLPTFSDGTPMSVSSPRGPMTANNQKREAPLDMTKECPEKLKEYIKASPRLSLDERARISKV